MQNVSVTQCYTVSMYPKYISENRKTGYKVKAVLSFGRWHYVQKVICFLFHLLCVFQTANMDDLLACLDQSVQYLMEYETFDWVLDGR